MLEIRHLVKSFGPLVAGGQTGTQQAAGPRYPAVEVYTAGAAGPLSPVSTLATGQTVLVNGGPDSLLQLTGQHLLGPGQPTIIAGDPLPVRPAQWAVTDGQPRADNAFSLLRKTSCFLTLDMFQRVPGNMFACDP